MNNGSKQNISFAEFELDVTRRRLTCEGAPIAVNAKAFDLLVFLTENAGRVVSKDEILNAVWKDQFVEEANLTVQISALRKALGERRGAPRFLVTIPGRGYEFVGDIRTSDEMVIEDHRFSRIVIEETETSETPAPRSERSASSVFLHVTRTTVLTGGVLLILLAGAAVWLSGAFDRNGQPADIVSASGRKVSAHFFPAAGGGMPERVAISSDGKMLAFSSRIKRQESLWVGNIEDGHSIQIIPLAECAYGFLSFGPENRYIYFTIRDVNHRKASLMRVSVFGGAVQELVSDTNSPATFSPDGRSMAFLRKLDGDETSIIVADADTGKNERTLATSARPENALNGAISWSPDGQRIAFAVDAKEGGTKLLAVSPADGSVDEIGDTFANRIVSVVWTADGKGLVVNRNTSNDAGDGRLWFVPYPTGEPRQITDDTLNYHIASLSISSDLKIAALQARSDPRIYTAPDGELQNLRGIFEGTRFRAEGRHGLAVAPDGKVLFAANSSESRTIWEMNVDGGDQRQLTPSQRSCYDQQVSVTADDRTLVFESNRSGALEIWRANRDGTDLKQLTAGGGNIEPVLSPDGTSIIYVSDHDGRSQLWRISIDGTDPTQLTSEKSFWPAVSPDGRLIAYAHSSTESSLDRTINVISVEDGALIKSFEVPLSAALYNRLRWSPDGRAIVYKDEGEGLWSQELSKENPRPVESPDDLRIYQFAYSADGKVAYSAGTQSREIVILENFR